MTVELVDINTKGTKETNEIGLALKDIVVATSKALEDGFQPGQDLPTILLTAVTKLSVAIEGYEKVPAEFKEETVKALMGALIPISEGIESLLHKKVIK
jgi:hypothetical protein